MNNLRLFYQKKLSANLTGNLDKKQSHYVNKVMRLKENDKFNVFNESGEWVAKINKILKGLIEHLGQQVKPLTQFQQNIPEHF